MMDVSELIYEGIELFHTGKCTKAIETLNEALENISNETEAIQNQIHLYDIYMWLGECHLKLALETLNSKKADALFDKAYEYYLNQLFFAEKQRGDEGIKAQMTSEFSLGNILLKRALKTSDFNYANNFLEQAIKHHKNRYHLCNQLKGEDGFWNQMNAQRWLGQCYLEKAMMAQDLQHANESFNKAIEYCNKSQFSFQNLTKLYKYDFKYEEAIILYLLIRAYLEKYKSLGNIQTVEANIKNYLRKIKALSCPRKDIGGIGLVTIHDVEKLERELYFLTKQYDVYFDSKKEYIRENFISNTSYIHEVVISILAVLSIAPVEFNKPLAHYTNPFVCEKLLGIKQKKGNQLKIDPSKMRMNSSTYMNDPYEGKSLLDFLGVQESSLENKTEFSPHNAFFSCFSTRVNDLN